MVRVVLPELLVLHLGTLDEAHAAGRYAAVEQEFGSRLRQRAHDVRDPGVPVSLRWVANPLLGFPRAPFEVWRRTRKEEPVEPVAGSAPRVAPTTVVLPDPVLEIRFETQVDAARTLVVEALGSGGRVLPGQHLSFAAGTRAGRFRAPGITALRLSGSGQVRSLAALVQSAWANLPDWIRIETVGFPFDPGQLPESAYDPGKQGWETPTLSGPDAALIRMGVAGLLQLDPPAPGGGLTAPAWPFPDPGRFLDVLRAGPLGDIEQCLIEADDNRPDLLQALHGRRRSVPGIHQPGLSTGGQPAELSLSTTQYIALAVQDGPAAVGLGFGTTDFPGPSGFSAKPADMPPGSSIGGEEYLVTATVRLWTGTDIEVAAIGHRSAAPTAFIGLAPEESFRNRAITRDGPESVAVRLSWAAPAVPVGAGLLSRRAPAATELFNTARPGEAGGFQPYLTEHRTSDDGRPSAELRPGVTMPAEPVPLSGTLPTSYAAAPVDVHGRWGPWRLTQHTTTARPVQRPGLHAVELQLPDPLPATAPVARRSTLVVDVSWDWSDRSPALIEVSGAFVQIGPPPKRVIGFQQSSAVPVAVAPIRISFSGTGVSVGLRNAKVVEVTPDGDPLEPPPPDGTGEQVRTYRLTVELMTLSFAGADQLAFAVSARAAERGRPDERSDPTDVRATTVGNPFPAPPPALPPVTVLWTAQPDAAGRARTVLSWPAVPGAAGYVVWQATEAALFDAVSGGGSRPAGVPIRARAQDLLARVADNDAAGTVTFSRLNERLLTGTSVELVLPGAADTLFAYRVSSITTQNVESPRSPTLILVGVPHREVPGTPRLTAQAEPGTGTVSLTVVPGVGVAPTSLRLYRVRRETLAVDVGTMGPPVLSTPVDGLTPVPVPALSGPVETGWALTDTVTPGWAPCFYRCVAVGRDAPDDGVRAGDSPPSGVVRLLVAPPLPPLLEPVLRTDGPAGTVVQLRTDLPAGPTPAGRGSMTIAAVAAGNRTVLAVLDLTTIAVGAPLTASGAAATAVAATRRRPENAISEVSVLVPPGVPGALVITATDPLGRSTTVVPE